MHTHEVTVNRRGLLAICLSVLPLVAQSYQSAFSGIQYERSRTPATLHGGVDVDAPSGTVKYNFQLGPGIGARGVRFQPSISGRVAPVTRKAQGPNTKTLLEGSFLMTTYNTYTASDQGNSGTAGIGYLSIPLNRLGGKIAWLTPEGQQITGYRVNAAGSAGSHPKLTDPAFNALDLVAKYPGYASSWTLAGFPSGTGSGNTGTFLGASVEGDLIIGLTNSSATSNITNVPTATDGQTAIVFPPNLYQPTPTYLSLAPVVLVIRGGVAYEYLYDRTVMHRYKDPTLHVDGSFYTQYAGSADYEVNLQTEREYPDLYYGTDGQLHVWEPTDAYYRLNRIMNRTGDEIRFTAETPAAGGVGIKASWFVDGLDTHVALHLSGGSASYEGLGYASDYTWSWIFARDAAQPAFQNGFVPTNVVVDAQGNFGSCDSGLELPVTWRPNQSSDSTHPSPAIITCTSTQESVSFSYSTSYPGVLQSVTFPGRTMGLTWSSYAYRRNGAETTGASGFLGYLQAGDLKVGYSGGLAPSYATAFGVTQLTETDSASGVQRITTHDRTVPVPDGTLKGGRQMGGWNSTLFRDVVTHPDGSVTVTSFVEPLANNRAGGSADNDAVPNFNEWMQTLCHLKHQVKEIREYELGVPWSGDLGTAPAQSVAYRITMFDRWDLRSMGNPLGDFNASSTPYPTRTRVWDKAKGLLEVSEKLNWDISNLGWKTDRRMGQSLGSDSGAIQYLSLAQQGVAASGIPSGSSLTPWVREQARVFNSEPDAWVFGRTDREQSTHAELNLGTAGGAAVSMALPPMVITWEATPVKVSRPLSIVVGTSPAISTTFTYGGTSGPAAVQRKSVTMSSPGLALSGLLGVADYHYDPKGFLDQITPKAPSTDPLVLKQTNTGSGLASDQTDANGIKTTIGWGNGGRLAALSLPNAEVGTTYAYDADNLGVTITHGQQVSYLRFNGFGEPIREARFAADGTWSHRRTGYDMGGRKLWETVWLAGKGDGTDATWAVPLTTGDTDAWSEQVCSEWEAVPIGQPAHCLTWVTVDHPAKFGSQATHFEYDGQGRLTRTTTPNGDISRVTFAAMLNADGSMRKSVTTGLKLINGTSVGTTTATATTNYDSDPLGRLVRVTDALNQVTRYTYDPADRIAQVVQWPGAEGTGTAQTRSWEYNSLGWVTALVQPESGRTEYSGFTVRGKATTTKYGVVGGVATRTLNTTFDELERVKAISSTDGSVSQTLNYGEGGSAALAAGKLTSATSNGATRTLAYNGTGGLNGRLTTLSRGMDGQTWTQRLTYNQDGSLQSRTYPDGKVQKLDYAFDKGLPKSTGFGASPTASDLASLTIDPTMWAVTNIAYANGASTGLTYRPDQVGLKSMIHAAPWIDPTTTKAWTKGWTYTYDNAGNLSNDGEDYYGYDLLYRLKSVSARDPFNATANQGLQQAFTYDAFGNRTALTSLAVTNWTANTVPPATPTTTATTKAQTYAFNTSDTALVGRNRLPATTSASVATGALYDEPGNLTRIYSKLGDTTTQLTLSYDALGRVTSLGDSKNASSQTYGYDEEGLRLKIFDSKTNKTTYNVYSEGRQLIATYEKVGTGAVIWKKDILYVGTKEVAEIDATKTWVTFVDHLGSPRFIWDGTANPVKWTNLIEQKFMPFGESLANPADAAKFAKGFTNHEQTDPSGLIYMQARFYAPWFGRFLSPDPGLDQHFQDTQSWNIYSYVTNNPTMRIDPTGMFGDGPLDYAKAFVTQNFLYQGAAQAQDTIAAGVNWALGTDLPMVSNLGRGLEANPGQPTSTTFAKALDPTKEAMEAALLGRGAEKLFKLPTGSVTGPVGELPGANKPGAAPAGTPVSPQPNPSGVSPETQSLQKGVGNPGIPGSGKAGVAADPSKLAEVSSGRLTSFRNGTQKALSNLLKKENPNANDLVQIKSARERIRLVSEELKRRQ